MTDQTFQYEDGTWGFWDETEADSCMVFPTKEQAEQGLDDYCAWLGSGQVIGRCSRCRKILEDFKGFPGYFTTGYYDVRLECWYEFGNLGESYICDCCMFEDFQFIAIYGKKNCV